MKNVRRICMSCKYSIGPFTDCRAMILGHGVFLSIANGFITCQDPAVLHVLLVVCNMLLVYRRLPNVAVRIVMFYKELKQNTTRFSSCHPVLGGNIKMIFNFYFTLDGKISNNN